MNPEHVAWMVQAYQYPPELDLARKYDRTPMDPPPPPGPRMRIVFVTKSKRYPLWVAPDMRISDAMQALHAFRLVFAPYQLLRFSYKGRVICFDDPHLVGELGLEHNSELYLSW